MTHNTTIDAYDQFADAYDQGVIDFWDEFPEDFLETFTDELTGKRILNLGSGSGRDALLLRDLGLDVICVDGAQSMVDITASLGFESHLATFDTMSFKEGSFDGIWAHGSLLHISKEDAAETLRYIRSLLKSDGLLAVGVIKGSGEDLITHDIMPGKARYFQFYESEELQRLVTSLGFHFLSQKDYVLPYDTFLNHLYKLNEIV
jgi:SAM-dependent methyltransferase